MKAFFKKYWILCTVVVIFVVLQIVLIQPHATPYWDAAVYVGMGKYLFSHGTIGTWETLRPVALPIILGAFWKIGINPYTVGIVFSLAVSSSLIVLVYAIAEHVKEGAGGIAALLLASSATYFTFAAVPVTDITSTFFAVWSLWLTYRARNGWQFFVAGIMTAVAFMFRFPQGLLLLVTMLMVFINMFIDKTKKGKWSNVIVTMIERVLLIAGGFCVIAIPFLIINYYFYGNAFLPFIEGTAGISGYPSLYQKGVWFYIVQLFREDFLYVFSLLPFALLFYKKVYRTKLVIALCIAIALVGGYFILYQTHKELRYGLAFLPYVIVLAGVGIAYVIEWTKVSRMLFFGLFIIIAFMLSAHTFAYAGTNPNNQAFYDFDTYLQNAPKARVMTAAPFMFAYTDVLLTHNLYSDWNNAYDEYNAYRSTTDYIALDSCDLELDCTDDPTCKDDKQLLLNELNNQDTKVFDETTPQSQCQLLIYKIRH
jgi:4-amino-4-deoxy-L-arabinose transferase-like glycosyltransferase